ncbi:MAG TPA: DUF1007 family protein [Nanoarchaeota archaeon]|nr:DUF1007 family protein [Nanoarchaeota archaeon]HIH63126.1 DUF1007 family protein [Nanoarchaeota archaeon]HIJ09175.1 DUF1007 family protein [Nanoarchaeota archaeon]
MGAISGKTYLTRIPHERGEITFQHPSFKGTYGSLAQQIDADGLQRPTSAQTASLVYDAFQNPKGKYETEIQKILKDFWLVEFNGNLYLPKHKGKEVHNGVIVEANPTIENGRLVMDRKALTERLKKNDPSVKFVPFGYAVGEQSTYALAKNPYIIARYGEVGADKIAYLASKYKRNPIVWSFESVDSEIVRMSALDDCWYFDGMWLNVGGDGWNDCSIGFAFGVKK